MFVSRLFCFNADVDECGNPNTCGSLQQCFNTAGSYFCKCILGYENDPHLFFNCIGEVYLFSPHLQIVEHHTV